MTLRTAVIPTHDKKETDYVRSIEVTPGRMTSVARSTRGAEVKG